MRRSWMIVFVWLATIAGAMAQSWSAAYEAGLQAASSGNWLEARKAFQEAIAYRPEDYAQPTILPGPISEQRQWRDGAPYSPNFLAAYSGFKAAMDLRGEERVNLLRAVASELEALIAKEQFSTETFFFLNATYNALSDVEKRIALEAKFSQLSSENKIRWKVDQAGITPEDRAVVSQTSQAGTGQAGTGATGTITNPPTGTGTGTGGTILSPPVIGRVPPLANKYALVIGNTASQMQDNAVAFASDDAMAIRESLITDAGYLEENVELVLNATAEQIRTAVQALAERLPQDATVFLFFAGVGSNIDGKDYLAGVDTEFLTDSSSMVAKSDIYAAFMAKGAKLFSFYETNRPMASGRYFGAEVPRVGAIAQSHGTMPGGTVFSFVRGGKTVGVYTNAIVQVLRELRSNQVPILEFSWQVFYRVRRGGSDGQGGGSNQTPTLPVFINLASNTPF